MPLLTIACKDEKFVIICQVVDDDIRVGSYYLLLRGKVGALLEFEVSDGTGQCKVAVDTSKVDKSASSRDTRFFTFTKTTSQLHT